jgi:hypothetical protein
MNEIARYFADHECACEESMYTVYIYGVGIDMCDECMTALKKICYDKAHETPHCVTLHPHIDESMTLSVCTGAVMRLSTEGLPRWIDNMSGCRPPNTYSSVLSEIARLVPYPDYINSTRAGLLYTYMSQSICIPECTYDPTRTVVPLYDSSPLMIPDGYESADRSILFNTWTKSLCCVLQHGSNFIKME